jgi:Ca2+-transporting ATPase
MRRALTPMWMGPFVPFWLWMGVPLLLSVLAVELPFLQDLLGTTSLTGLQWLAVLALSSAVPVVSEAVKALRRRGHARTAPRSH